MKLVKTFVFQIIFVFSRRSALGEIPDLIRIRLLKYKVSKELLLIKL